MKKKKKKERRTKLYSEYSTIRYKEETPERSTILTILESKGIFEKATLKKNKQINKQINSELPKASEYCTLRRNETLHAYLSPSSIHT